VILSAAGAVRSSARLASLASAAGLAVVGPLLFARAFSPSAIVEAQRFGGVWYVALQPVAFLVFCTAVSAAAGRAGVLVASAVAATLFLGGWSAPWPGGAGRGVAAALASSAVFAGKVAHVAYALLRARRELERRGWDRLPDLGWRWLVPAALANVVLTALSLAVALGWRTPMGGGILAEASGDGLWIGWLGYAYFLFASAATAALVWLLLSSINREPVSVSERLTPGT
jgi:NADH-quinone oxidoreductase subunit H